MKFDNFITNKKAPDKLDLGHYKSPVVEIQQSVFMTAVHPTDMKIDEKNFNKGKKIFLDISISVC